MYLFDKYISPPKKNSSNEIIRQFTDELSSLLLNLSKSKSTIILTGDFNIDLLRMKERPIFREYLESMLSFGLTPLLTLPTRITDLAREPSRFTCIQML